MSDSWFDSQVAPDGEPTDGCDPQEAISLKSYLRSPTAYAEEAARAIVSPVETIFNTSGDHLYNANSSNNFHRLWNLIINALNDLPEHRAKVVQLLKAIKALPPTLRTGARSEQDQILWANLPHFGHLLGDLRVSGNWRNNVTKWGPEQREGVREDFIREARIEAQLVSVGIFTLEDSNGLWTVCDALERSDAVLDFDIPAASEWLQLVGKYIYEQSDEAMTGDSKERDLWKQEGATGKARWHFWRQRLQSLAGSKDLEQESKDSAQAACEAMDSVASDT